MVDGADIFSKSDCLLLLETMSDCLVCPSALDVKRIVDKVAGLIDFDHAVYGLAQLDACGCITTYEILNFSYPVDWLETYRNNNFHLLDPIARENFRSFGLQYWDDTYNKCEVKAKFISTARDFRLVDGYARGVVNASRTEGCIFSISGAIKKDSRHEALLNLLTPHLHHAFSAALSNKKRPTPGTLTSREKEVLNWVKKGKSSWDISAILNISERTVKFHVDNIMKKLDVVSRVHAVAVALSAGLIDID